MNTQMIRQTSPAYLPQVSPEAIEQAMAIGDLARMSPEIRIAYYLATCQSAGLNPMTRPFDLIKGDDGTVRLYPNKVAAEQLRKLHRVSTDRVTRAMDQDNDLYIVTVYVSTPDGRKDEAQGIGDVAGKKGTALANLFMRCETKAKRRATLSLCGLGYEDSEDAPGHPVRFDYQRGEVEQEHSRPLTTQAQPTSNPIHDLYGDRTPTRARTTPPPQTDLLGVADATPPAQQQGGEMFIAEIDAVMKAHGEDDAAIQTYWQRTCVRCKVNSPEAIKAAWLPRLLDERREFYLKRAAAHAVATAWEASDLAPTDSDQQEHMAQEQPVIQLTEP